MSEEKEKSPRQQLEDALDAAVKKLVVETIDQNLVHAFVVEEIQHAIRKLLDHYEFRGAVERAVKEALVARVDQTLAEVLDRPETQQEIEEYVTSAVNTGIQRAATTIKDNVSRVSASSR